MAARSPRCSPRFSRPRAPGCARPARAEEGAKAGAPRPTRARPRRAVRPRAARILPAPAVAGAREERAPRIVEGEEERLAGIADAGIPVDDGGLLGAGQ